MSTMSERLFDSTTTYARFSKKIGLLGAFTLAVLPRLVAALGRRFGLAIDRMYLPVIMRGYPGVAWMRLGSSDFDVMRQIFVVQEFECIVNDIYEPRYIVDCGANSGYASIYFLERFPNATLAAIEPDHRNVVLCEENLERYRDRVTIVEAAVWPDEAGLVVEMGIFADGREWATRVREVRAGEAADVQGVNIGTILDASGFDAIDLLKVDIENAEAIVFGANVERWLPRVKNIVIELHDTECERVFFAALAGYEYECSRQGNLTICKGLHQTTLT